MNCPKGDQATHSRWYRPTPGARPWDGSLGENAFAALREMPINQAVLIPGANDAALWSADIPQSEFAQRFRVSSSSHQTQEILQDKSRFAAFLQGTDIPHPPTYRIDSAADIDAMPFEALDRVFIKPVNSQKFSDVVGVKGIWVKRRQDLHDIWQQLDGQGFRLMAQEYVPGSAADHNFVDGFRAANGKLSGLFKRRRVRISPPDFGISSYSISIPLADLPGPIESIKTLLAKLDYPGIFSAESSVIPETAASGFWRSTRAHGPM